ncbi:hypothetical protein [Corynebacterium efficiens]|uniref:hypothetical protein n=1 Tax=Corynebacterium efficiens TaxID=152794 RepID=UPI00117E5FB5|nr:hypothetical protein [Corynebacterium efficiens]
MQFEDSLKLEQAHKENGSPEHKHHYVREHHLGSGTGDEACTICGDQRPRRLKSQTPDPLKMRAQSILEEAEFNGDPTHLANWAAQISAQGEDPHSIAALVLEDGSIWAEVGASRTQGRRDQFTFRNSPRDAAFKYIFVNAYEMLTDH